MSDVPSTVYQMEMLDGSTVPLSLTYDALYKLKTENPAQLDEYNRIMKDGTKTELDTTQVIYTAYLCGLIKTEGSAAGAMGYVDFLAMLSPDREYLASFMLKLVAPKKTMASLMRSAAARASAKM